MRWQATLARVLPCVLLGLGNPPSTLRVQAENDKSAVGWYSAWMRCKLRCAVRSAPSVSLSSKRWPKIILRCMLLAVWEVGMGARVLERVFLGELISWLRPRGRPVTTHRRTSHRTRLYPTVTPMVVGIVLYSSTSACYGFCIITPFCAPLQAWLTLPKASTYP